MMPNYDYKCSICGRVQEVHHSIKADPIVACEICGCVAKRLISGGGYLELNGEGFYQNDYKKKEEK